VTTAPADRTTTARATRVREVTDPHWWVVRARYADGWHAIVVSASERMVRLLPNPDGSWPTGVTVTAIDHAGGESPAR
jgi:hypothetical protein